MQLQYIFEIVEIDKEFVAVPIGDNASEFRAVLKLNKTGKRVLELLQENASKDEIVATILSEFDGGEQDVHDTVTSFMEQLKKAGVLK